MISIIIASVNETQLKDVKISIANTIGVEYEIISFDNSKGEKGLCQIYNEGAEKANFNYLCYMHEDIDIRTSGWGETIINHFEKDADLGIIGVVGSSYKSFSPSGWGAESEVSPVKHTNYIQSYKHLNKDSELIYNNPTKATLANVVCVDGMWFCTQKSILKTHKFDDNLLTGFHCYDLDFCLNVSQRYKIAVTFEILMEHFSEGTYTKGWVEDTLKIHKKWQHVLPVSTIEISAKNALNIEKRSFRLFMEKLLGLGYTYEFIKSILVDYRKSGSLSSKLYFKLRFYLLKYVLLKSS